MKIRGDSSTVGEGPDKDHALLAAFLEATSRIDRRAVQRSVALPEVPDGVDLGPVGLEPVDLEPVDLEPVNLEPVNLEAEPTSRPAESVSLEAHPTSLDAQPTPAESSVRVVVAPFTFRRANLVRA